MPDETRDPATSPFGEQLDWLDRVLRRQGRRHSRRELLAALGVLGLAGVAGCGGTPGAPAAATPSGPPATPATSPPTPPGARPASPSPATVASPAPSASPAPAAAASPAAAAARGRPGRSIVLKWGTQGEPETLDPHISTSIDTQIERQLYESLIMFPGQTLEPAGVLAERWEVSPDALSFTFYLRQGVTFTDGTPFDAAAVKYNVDRVQALKTGTSWVLDLVASVQVVDPTTVKFTIKQPYPFLAAMPLIMMVSPTAAKANEKDGDWAKGWFYENGVGTGPYALQRWTHNQEIVAAAYPDYWRGWQDGQITEVRFLHVAETGTQRQMLERGDLDIGGRITYAPDSWTALERNPAVSLLRQVSLGQNYLKLNCVAGPTKDKRVRLAFAYAFDYAGFNALMNNSVPQRSDGPCPSEFLDGFKPTIPYYTYDLDKAKALLAEAGVANGGFEIGFYYPAGIDAQKTVGEYFQSALSKLNVKVNIVPVVPAVFTSTPQKEENTKDETAWNAMPLLTPPRVPDPYAFIWFMYNSAAAGPGSGRNLMWYKNAEVDDLTNKALITVDRTQRLDLWQRAAQLIIDDCPDIYLQRTVSAVAYRKDLSGHEYRPFYAGTDFIIYNFRKA